MNRFVTFEDHISFRAAPGASLSPHYLVFTMQVNEKMVANLLKQDTPVGKTGVEDRFDVFSTMRERMNAGLPELHGHAVTMAGKVVVPELCPGVDFDRQYPGTKI